MWELEGAAFVIRQELPVAVKSGTIVDLETTGIQPSKSHIICLGCVFGTTLEIRAKSRKATWKGFYNHLRPVVKALPRPFHAYNAKFDKGFLKRHLGYRGSVIDLFEPWRSRAESRISKWPSLDELIRGPWDAIPPHMAPVRDAELPTPGVLREDEEKWLTRRGRWKRQAWEARGLITGKDIPRLWREYLKGDDEALRQIGEHNRQDLIKTLCLLAFLTRPLTE